MKKQSVFLACLLIILCSFSSLRAEEPPGKGLSGGKITPSQIKAFLNKKPKSAEDQFIILNFDNADLKDVISTISQITQENFIITPGVGAQITIHSSKKIPVSEVMNVFESVLEANNMALVRSGEFFKIVPGPSAKQKKLEVRTAADLGDIPDRDRPVTQLVPVNFIPVTEASTVLTPLLSQVGSIIPNTRNNLLIINDLSSNIIRLLQVLKEIDVNAFKNSRMFFFKPKYSDVLTLSDELNEVLSVLNLSGEGIAIVPIERINSLIIFSASKKLLNAIEGWIRKLDEEVVTGRHVFVYPVQNVKAQDIAEILTNIYEANGGSDVRRLTKTTQRKTAKSRTTAKRTVRRTATQKTGGSRVEIITFEPTNSLVILAPPGIYRDIVKTIRKIDVYPREVLIEAIIAEVTLSDAEKLGIQWSVLHNVNIEGNTYKGLAQGSSGLEDLPSLAAQTFPPALGAAPDGGISYILFRSNKLMSMVNALASESKVKILSSPRLLVRDQEEASIEVGSDIPTATSTTQTTTTDTLTQNIEYRTVGIKLKIKPTISEDKTVVLDIEQEVSSKGESQQVGQSGNLFPTFTTTKAKTSIVVPDKQGILIGGIMQEKKDRSYQGIPLLSKIPILGPIFRYRVNSIVKKELVIIINPHVVSTRDEADVLTRTYMEKLRAVREFLQEKQGSINYSPDGVSDKQVNEP
jgi:general secretion pathway protein D